MGIKFSTECKMSESNSYYLFKHTIHFSFKNFINHVMYYIENGQTYFENLAVYFKVYLAISQHYAWKG